MLNLEVLPPQSKLVGKQVLRMGGGWNWSRIVCNDRLCYECYILCPSLHNSMTARHGRVVNTPASYSGGSGFKSWPGDQLPWMSCSWFSSVYPSECRDSTLILDHERFLPNPFQFIFFTYHPFIWCYIVWVSKRGSPSKLQTGHNSMFGKSALTSVHLNMSWRKCLGDICSRYCRR
jgi:hypothetical protein